MNLLPQYLQLKIIIDEASSTERTTISLTSLQNFGRAEEVVE